MSEVERAQNFFLQKEKQCVLCSGCENDQEFDYCRACGFTTMPIAKRAPLLPLLGEGRILNVAVELHAFVKTHEYPKEMSPEFIQLTELFDKLETELRRAGVIK